MIGQVSAPYLCRLSSIYPTSVFITTWAGSQAIVNTSWFSYPASDNAGTFAKLATTFTINVFRTTFSWNRSFLSAWFWEFSFSIGGETGTRTLKAVTPNGFQDRTTTNYHTSPLYWWKWKDLNFRPLGYQPSALTNCATLPWGGFLIP